MLDAAAHVMRTRGLARATTKEIAKEAGFSEAALYKHFRDKTDLFLAVLAERVPSVLGALLTGLTDRVGTGSVQDTLEEIARAAMVFYGQTFPMGASLFSDPPLLAAHRAALDERGAGPHHLNDALTRYLAAEQKSGRIRPDVDPAAASALLLGACFQHAFLSHFTERPGDGHAADLARALCVGISC
jgi:AcrR family transcriptional regulator